MLKSSLLLFFTVTVGLTGCSYRCYAEDLQPLSEAEQEKIRKLPMMAALRITKRV